jgi:hypothetical protein
MGYISVGMFLAVVDVSPGRLSMRARPAFIASGFGLSRLEVTPQDGLTIYPAHKFAQEGIEIRIPGSPSYYFWVKDRLELIDVISAAGLACQTPSRITDPGFSAWNDSGWAEAILGLWSQTAQPNPDGSMANHRTMKRS